jgi:hypothetical protein
LLAEGDSWFTIGGIPTSNLLFSLRFHKATMIANCGTPGDTIVNMAQLTRNRSFRQALSPNDGKKWSAILLSGGGNDLIDAVDEILIPKVQRSTRARKPAKYCDQGKLTELLESVQQGYRTLAGLRDAPGAPSIGVPIVTHTYDYVTPRNSPARFLVVPVMGPWLYPALTAAEVPEGDWQATSDYLLRALAEAITALQTGTDKISNFHVVNTLGTLRRARPGAAGESGDWLNEIHPDFDGYHKLARALEPTIDGLLS